MASKSPSINHFILRFCTFSYLYMYILRPTMATGQKSNFSFTDFKKKSYLILLTKCGDFHPQFLSSIWFSFPFSHHVKFFMVVLFVPSITLKSNQSKLDRTLNSTCLEIGDYWPFLKWKWPTMNERLHEMFKVRRLSKMYYEWTDVMWWVVTLHTYQHVVSCFHLSSFNSRRLWQSNYE